VFELYHADGRSERFATAENFIAAILKAVKAQPTVQAVYAFWESNLNSFATLPHSGNDEDPMRLIGSAIKERLHILTRGERDIDSKEREPDQPYTRRRVIVGTPSGSETNSSSETKETNGEKARAADITDQMPLPGRPAFPKEQRVRDKAHLAFVATEPCLVCGRRPAQAHHIRFAQPRALGLKVSDEFTVPLCNGHHDSLHSTSDERAWWARHGILDPIQIANRLWAASRQNGHEQRSDADKSLHQSKEPPW
jgi:hypothetical protein